MQSFKSEAAVSEDIFAHLQETQESVRIQLLNAFLDLAGNLDNYSLYIQLGLSLRHITLNWWFLAY